MKVKQKSKAGCIRIADSGHSFIYGVYHQSAVMLRSFPKKENCLFWKRYKAS